MSMPEYDRYGRMKYHPEYHPNQNKSWTTTDQKYLIQNYEKDGPAMVAAALGRTIGVIMTRAYELRKSGLMPRRISKTRFSRR